ncbi:unnamed protein product [Schistosoma margrebowiei]|uniref:Uncharacterized protein n=1 Tax=Schistosoma margrebowiei TaxID=48269 RepID=A0A3P7XC48_9TREM|nr:unnamed protein product [Schistosoma margrebowiei]
MTTAAVVLSEVSSLYTRLAARRRRETIRDIFDISLERLRKHAFRTCVLKSVSFGNCVEIYERLAE